MLVNVRSAMQRRIKLEHRRCNNSEAYSCSITGFTLAGSASATDGATPAARLKMVTAVEASMISNRVLNVVKL